MGIDRPNVVFIESDSMDGRAMGCMGHSAAYTPNMDRLASRGVLFTNAYCNSPQCCPSRASMWSGQYVHRVEAWNNYKGLDEDDPTWLTHLEAAGYRSKVVGKTDYVSGHHSLGARVTAWTGPASIKVPGRAKRPRAEVVATPHGDWHSVEACLDWLDNHAKESPAPFVLYCGLNLPHPPFRTMRRWFDLIDENKVSLPPFEEELHPVMDFMRVRKGCVGEFSDDEIRAIRQSYYAMVADLDAMVGCLIDRVDALGLSDSTYVMYLSDHGEMNMEHRMHLKNSLYEPSARVPLIIAGPGVGMGQVVDDLVSLVDIYPTLMDMAGVAGPGRLDGYSLLPELQGSANPHRVDSVFSEYHSNFQNTSSFMLRRGDWKYVAYPGFESQLFNLTDDPDEMHNLSGLRPDVAEAMAATLREIADYSAVAADVVKYDKEAFRQWRRETPSEVYEEAMSQFFQGWGPEQKETLEDWLQDRHTMS